MSVKIAVERYDQNPILQPDENLGWMATKVYNPGVVFGNGVYNMLFRARGKDEISRLGYARSTNGINFDLENAPVLEPIHPWELLGCEDPRITKVGAAFIMTYTAFDGRTAKVAQTSTEDFHAWAERRQMFPDWHEGLWNQPEKRRIILPTFDPKSWTEKDGNWSKASAIFPEKINGKSMLFFGEDNIWPATSDDLVSWIPNKEPVLTPRNGFFDSAYIEMGPPPIKTEQGWLIIYNGVDRFDQSRIYRIGAALTDISEPAKVLWRSSEPILEPKEPYELSGIIDVADSNKEENVAGAVAQKKTPQAIFSCGAVAVGENKVNVYYGGADKVVCLATLSIKFD